MKNPEFKNPKMVGLVPDKMLDDLVKALDEINHDIKALEAFLKMLPIDCFCIDVDADRTLHWDNGRVSYSDNCQIDLRPLIESKILVRYECAPYLPLVLKRAIELAQNAKYRSV